MKGFKTLDLYFKRNILKQQANYLISTIHLHYTVRLYSWDRFFIEQYYDNEMEQITRITLACHNDMDKYMNDISLADIGLLL